MVTKFRFVSLLLIAGLVLGSTACTDEELTGSDNGASVETSEVRESCADENRVEDCTDDELLAELEAVQSELEAGYTEENYLLYLALADTLDDLFENSHFQHRPAVLKFKAKPRYVAPSHVKAPTTFNRRNIRLTVTGPNGTHRVEVPAKQGQAGVRTPATVNVLQHTPPARQSGTTPSTTPSARTPQVAVPQTQTPTQSRSSAPQTTGGNVQRGVLGSTQTNPAKPTAVAPSPTTQAPVTQTRPIVAPAPVIRTAPAPAPAQTYTAPRVSTPSVSSSAQ